ncbi:Ionotropic receptor 25a [Armadillidium vulgare]|nr:Ionotropic receptor 25a [Armadillidium vulgare]
MEEKMQILPELSLEIHSINKSSDVLVGTWSTSEGLSLEPFFKNAPIKRFFRIGTIRAKPWMYDKPKDPNMKEKEGMKEMMYEGYCKDLADKLSSHMNFEYEFVFPADGKYGAKEKNGTWNGLVGDLAVVIRKKEREESLFKFMTVLKAEVWVSIVAALIVTGIMIWFLDKYSPYSAQNSSEYQMQEYRKFTLKESFWFALTSFTPQGGGEAPKALSGRTLVAAYWLFVVLMLATFTANLAAFLTVERMQNLGGGGGRTVKLLITSGLASRPSSTWYVIDVKFNYPRENAPIYSELDITQ